MLAVGANDSYARVYDRRKIKLTYVYHLLPCAQTTIFNVAFRKLFQKNSHNPTDFLAHNNIPQDCVTYFCPGHFNKNRNKIITYSHSYLTFSPDGTELLVNMGAEQIYLYDLNNAKEATVHNSTKMFCTSITLYNDLIIYAQFLDLPKLEKPETLPDSAADSTSVLPPPSKYRMSAYVDSLKKLGNDFLENENYLRAINQYTMAISLAGDYSVLYLNRATALMRRNW